MASDRTEYLREYLLLRLEQGFGAERGKIIAEENLWEEALGLVRSADNRLAFRASWALSSALESDPARTEKLLPVLVADYLASSNASVLRSYGKLIAITLPKTKKSTPARTRKQLAEKGLDILIDPKAAPAVKIWAMEILFCLREEEIVQEHLAPILQDLLERDPQPSIRNKTRKILHRLKKSLKHAAIK